MALRRKAGVQVQGHDLKTKRHNAPAYFERLEQHETVHAAGYCHAHAAAGPEHAGLLHGFACAFDADFLGKGTFLPAHGFCLFRVFPGTHIRRRIRHRGVAQGLRSGAKRSVATAKPLAAVHGQPAATCPRAKKPDSSGNAWLPAGHCLCAAPPARNGGDASSTPRVAGSALHEAHMPCRGTGGGSKGRTRAWHSFGS